MPTVLQFKKIISLLYLSPAPEIGVSLVARAGLELLVPTAYSDLFSFSFIYLSPSLEYQLSQTTDVCFLFTAVYPEPRTHLGT